MDFRKIFSAILLLIGVLLALGGLQLLLLGGSVYYLFAGLAVSYSSWCLWDKSHKALSVYGIFLLVTVAWSFMES